MVGRSVGGDVLEPFISEEQRALLPAVSGNALNGLGETARRRPTAIYWHPPSRNHPFAAVQTWMLRKSSREVPEVADMNTALGGRGATLQEGDVVMIRTGRMTIFESDPEHYKANQPGITLDAAKWLIDEMGAMTLGSDNLTLEVLPPAPGAERYIPVHTYLFAQRGALILEVLDLEALAADKVYEFAFIGGPLKLRGATGAPIRPFAIPIR